MPIYKKDINHIVTEQEALTMINSIPEEHHNYRFVVALLYLTGARPMEIRQLKRGAFTITEEGYNVVIPTGKLGNTDGFQIRTRTLPIRKDMPFFLLVDSYLFKFTLEQYLIPVSTTQIWRIVEKYSNGQFCPYNFRHSRLTKLARQGANLSDLMSWKGAKDARSVGAYLAAKPYEGKYKVE